MQSKIKCPIFQNMMATAYPLNSSLHTKQHQREYQLRSYIENIPHLDGTLKQEKYLAL